MDEIANEVAHDIREQYTIGYHSTKPASQGGFRMIHVEGQGQGLQQADRAHPYRLLP